MKSAVRAAAVAGLALTALVAPAGASQAIPPGTVLINPVCNKWISNGGSTGNTRCGPKSHSSQPVGQHAKVLCRNSGGRTFTINGPRQSVTSKGWGKTSSAVCSGNGTAGVVRVDVDFYTHG